MSMLQVFEGLSPGSKKKHEISKLTCSAIYTLQRFKMEAPRTWRWLAACHHFFLLLSSYLCVRLHFENRISEYAQVGLATVITTAAKKQKVLFLWDRGTIIGLVAKRCKKNGAATSHLVSCLLVLVSVAYKSPRSHYRFRTFSQHSLLVSEVWSCLVYEKTWCFEKSLYSENLHVMIYVGLPLISLYPDITVLVSK